MSGPKNYAGEHRGHRLVETSSPRGGKTYRLPERYVGRPISECIRGLNAEGWRRAEISSVTGILYQHVRNVLEGPDPGAGGAPPIGTPSGGTDSGGVEEGSIEEGLVGSVFAFCDLVAWVEHDGAVDIMRHGRAVAKLVPA
jgi:hypothetical protein